MSSKRRSAVRNAVEYGAVRLLEALLRCLPLRVARACGAVLGRAFRHVDRRHRPVAEANAARALGLDEAGARDLVRRVYGHLGVTAAEVVLLPHLLRRRPLRDFCQLEGAEHLHRALERGNGAMVITAHIGNWEFNGLALADLAGSALSVARALDNPLLDRYIRRVRESLGQRIVDREGALRPVVKQLHQNGVVGMLIDQNLREGGVFVDFLGRKASTVPAPAQLALKYDVPVLPAYGYRPGRECFFVCRIDPPFELIRTGDLEADVVANTAQFTRRIEQYVRAHPEQWLWLHRRWRKRPPEEKAARKAARRAAQRAASAPQTAATRES
jgi:KDO2-lipid IV(A) lauroyltransferase